jgi:hypothetical protein
MVSDDSGAVPPEDAPTPDERASVRAELNRLKAFARGLSLDDLREGAWFARLVRFSLEGYSHDIDASFFQATYPGRPAEQVVAARIQRAARLASIEGGISAGAYTGAVAASIGTGGGASPLTLPAAGISFVLDLLFVSHLQLRLAHDICVLHQVPLDVQDPEDLWKLVRVAFSIKGEEAGRGAIGKGVPVLVRPIVQRIMSGSTLTAAKSLPVVGRHLLQRNVVKFTIPAVGVPLSMAVNYWSTRLSGRQAVMVFGDEARIVAAARRLTERTVHHSELLWVLWLIVKSDALIHERERLLLKHVTALVGDLDTELAAIAGLGSPVDVDPKTVWARLASVTGDLDPLYEAGVVAAAVDGKINVNELKNLQKLAQACRVPYDEKAIRAAAAEAR